MTEKKMEKLSCDQKECTLSGLKEFVETMEEGTILDIELEGAENG